MYEYASWNANKHRLERDYESNTYLGSYQLMNNSIQHKAIKTNAMYIRLYKTTENNFGS